MPNDAAAIASNSQGGTRTRLDKAIRRLQVQRACLDWAVGEVGGLSGVVFELGLGNGRTYDHLRQRLDGRPIYVFERSVNVHPDCAPPADRLVLGNVEDTLPAASEHFAGKVALIHSDIGTGDGEHNRTFAAWLAPQLVPFLQPGGIVASDQPLADHRLQKTPSPAGVEEGRYFLYRLSPA